MTDNAMLDGLPPEDLLAAEYALGLLEGEELVMARGRLAREPQLAEKVAWWQARLAPLSDDIGGLTPDSALWARIERALDDRAQDSGEVVTLQRRLRNWQIAGTASAMAAVGALALVVLGPGAATGPGNIPVDPPAGTASPAAPLMASIPIGDTPLRLGVTYLPDSEQMLVSADGLSADGVHDHELWLVPADGSALQSLGVVAPGESRKVTLPDAIARNMGDGVALVLTREPLGGKPEGVDAGPVVAEGELSLI